MKLVRLPTDARIVRTYSSAEVPDTVMKILYSELTQKFYRIDEVEREVPSEPGTRLVLPGAPKAADTKPAVPRSEPAPIGVEQSDEVQYRPRWWKELSPSDALHPPKTQSHITGKLRLSKSGHAIDHKTFFRRDLFAGLAWRRVRTLRGAKFETYVPFDDVVIDGVSHGPMKLFVDHADYRIAGQDNVPTVMSWGPRLGTLLRATNYTGYWVVISSADGGRFRLEVRASEPS